MAWSARKNASLSLATRSSRGKGKPQLASFVQGSPVAVYYRPPVLATGPPLSCVTPAPPKKSVPSWGFFCPFTVPTLTQPKKDSQRPVDGRERSRFQFAKDFAGLLAGNGMSLVHHDLRAGAQAVSRSEE